jgi:Anaphase-promoting complex, cyclosome, subunit 3/Transglutaminase-like superfamily
MRVDFQFRVSDFGLRIGAIAIRNPGYPLGAAIRNRRVRILFCLATMLAIGVIGCRRPESSPGAQSQEESMRRAGRGDALLKAAAAQLSNLPADIDTQLRQPTIVLDSTPSGEDIVAICTVNPNVPDGTINYLIVPAGNSRFRTLGVRSGDILKYYLVEDETVDEERRLSGFSRWLAMEFTVAQVIDEHILLIEKGIPISAVKDYMQHVVDDDESLTPEMIARGVLIPAKIEIWRHLDDRLVEINQQLHLYWERRLPPLGWEPSPDSKILTQVVVWLNQWLRQSEKAADWRIDPLLETLDPALRGDPQLAAHISKEALEATMFKPHEGRLLQEAVWMRDISRWARGEGFDDLERAAALFDWTVRNVQLEEDENRLAHRPWQVLLYGHGTAEQRAWVFALICRQLGLDVVVLASKPSIRSAAESETAQSEAKFWLPALVHDDELYLFDTRLGMAIPGPGGQGVATLKQVQDDDGLLRQLDLEGWPYPMDAGTLKGVTAYVVADWLDLSRRAAQVEEKLTGDDRLALSTAPSSIAAALRALPHISEVRLWGVPFETLRDQLSLLPPARRREVLAFEPMATRPVLWKARMRHFQGRREGGDEQTATDPSEVIDDHGEAAQLYTDKSVRPADRDIEREQSDDKRRVDAIAKLNATYWLGLLSYDDGKYDVAVHWFSRPELSAQEASWSSGARYNLARTYESQKKLEEAIALLADDSSPQQHGNKLRARRLKLRMEEAKKADE